jgi:hypothetical protein
MGDGPYLCYKELNPSTSVVGSTFFQSFNKFTSQYEDFLCVITSSVFSIYQTQCKEGANKCIFSLEFLKFTKIFGKLRDVKRLKRGREEHDLLIVAIDEGKLVAVEFNVTNNQLCEFPLCNLEENAAGVASDVSISTSGERIHPGPGAEPLIQVNSDHDMVCAVVYGKSLFFTTITSSWEVKEIDQTLTRTFTYEKMLKNIHEHMRFQEPILDIVFVHGYGNPTIAILHQEHYVPVGHLKKVRHTCSLTVFTVDMNTQTMSILWTKGRLPHDSIKLVEVKNQSMKGSVIVITQNAIILANDMTIHALAVNSFASVTVTRQIQMHPWSDSKVGIELDGSYWAEYGDDSLRESSLIGFLRDGTVVIVRLLYILHQVLKSLRFDLLLIGESISASTVSFLQGTDLLFVGTRNSQKSALFRVLYRKAETSVTAYNQKLENARKWFFDANAVSANAVSTKEAVDLSALLSSTTAIAPIGAGGDTDIVSTVKATGENDERMKHILTDYDDDDDVIEDFELNEEIMNEERLFYGKTAIETDPSYQITRPNDWVITLAIQDVIHNFGPILSGIFTKSDDLFNHLRAVDFHRSGNNIKQKVTLQKTNTTAGSYINDRDNKDSLILASGVSNNSSLHRIIQGIGFHKVGNRNFLGATRMLSVPVPRLRAMNSFNPNLLLVSYETKTRVLLSKFSSSPLTNSNLPDIKFQEFAEESGFFTTSSTIFCGKISAPTESIAVEGKEEEEPHETVVQVIPLGVRMVKITAESNTFDFVPLQDMLLLEDRDIGGLGGKQGETILSADICFGFLILLTNYRRLFVVKYNFEDEGLELVLVQEAEGTKKQKETATSMEVDNDYEGGRPLSCITSEIVSASLYYGQLEVDLSKKSQTKVKTKSGIDDRFLSPVEKEELLFYGYLLKDLDENGNLKVREDLEIIEEEEEVAKNNEGKHQPTNPAAYLVVYEENGFLSIIRLNDLSCVLRSHFFTMQSDRVKNELNLSSVLEDNEQSLKLKNRYILETRLVKLNYSVNENASSSCIKQKLCLFLLFHTGELVVYHAFERNFKTFCWYKDCTKIIHNKRIFNYGKLNKLQVSESILLIRAESSQNGDSISFLDTDEYLLRVPQSMNIMRNFHNCSDVLLISSNDPLIYCLEKGNSSLFPVGFPETPCVNFGQFTVLPFYSAPAKTQRAKGTNLSTSVLATLWYEFEDIEMLKNPLHMKQRGQRQSTFGLYSLLPNQRISSFENISIQSIEFPGQTIQKLIEIAKLTDNTTEQALLDKKTYILFTSKDIYKDYDVNYDLTRLDDEGKDPEDIMYERYFPTLDSFHHPDAKLAPNPLMKDKEHRISILQAGKIVDSYLISEKEVVVDIVPLYFSIEKQVTQTVGILTTSMKVHERRVFLLVSVLNKDHRGEDSQGNGKILLLGFDYSMFDEEVTESDSAANEESSENKENVVASDGTNAVPMDEVSNGHSNGSKNDNFNHAHHTSSTANTTKNAQQQFLENIQPKLTLLWSGPGPASVVQQMPAFLPTANTYNPNPLNPNTPTDHSNATQMFSNYVLATVGATLYLYKLNSNTMELDQITFYFSQVST